MPRLFPKHRILALVKPQTVVGKCREESKAGGGDRNADGWGVAFSCKTGEEVL